MCNYRSRRYQVILDFDQRGSGGEFDSLSLMTDVVSFCHRWRFPDKECAPVVMQRHLFAVTLLVSSRALHKVKQMKLSQENLQKKHTRVPLSL